MNMISGSSLDGYTLKARYLPALIVVLPAWLAFAVWFPSDKMLEGVLASAGVTAALGAVVAQIGRDAGRDRQRSLFSEWGGPPTIQALSYRHKLVNKNTLSRCHLALNSLISGLNLPDDEKSELEDWPAAYSKYESASDYLREATREKSKFRLVYAENVNYGFRRNLWGMKPAGIGISGVGLALAALHVCQRYMGHESIRGVDLAAVFLCSLLLVFWFCRFTKNWVKSAAEAYAIQLAAAAETLEREKASA